MNRTILCATLVAAALTLGACRNKDDRHSGDAHDHPAAPAPAPTNRVDIPAPVRKNLGITFAKVEMRNVARTLRVPGRFELLPTARREYRPPMSGRVEVLVAQFQKIDTGTPLYRLDAPHWRELQEQIASTETLIDQTAARLASIAPTKEAHRQKSESLATKVSLYADRVQRLEQLQSEGVGIRKDLDEAKGTLSEAQAALAETTEHRAELDSRERELNAETKSLRSRLDLLINSAASMTGLTPADLQSTDAAGSPRPRTMPTIEVRAAAPGTIESLGVTNGSMVETGGGGGGGGAMVLCTLQPDQIRFHASALQADLGTLKDGLAARIVPPAGGSIDLQDCMDGRLVLGLGADPDERTIDLLLTPTALRPWARTGVAAYLEVVLDGGTSELAIPLSCITRDGVKSILFRRDPANPDKAIRMDADLGLNDGRWVVIASGVKENDEIVLDGVYQLMLATAGNAPKGGHFHSDGTFHEGEDK